VVVRRVAGVAVLVVLLVAAGFAARASWHSRYPATYNVMQFGGAEYGGAPSSRGALADVARLSGPRTGIPDVRYTLTAQHARVRLASGKDVDALTFDGRVPGPELRAHTGDLVEVVLRNKDVENGVTIHWHGIDVPNAEDGVAGVTQNAVPVGGRYVYRFRIDQTGTFWYHTHQDSQSGVERGLYGVFVIEPRRAPTAPELDLPVVVHTLNGIRLLNADDEQRLRTVAPGTRVRLRLVNSNDNPESLVLRGTPFEVLAVDGTDLNGPTPVAQRLLSVPAGGRYDLGFTMPAHPVRLDLFAAHAALVLSPDGRQAPAEPFPQWRDFDPFGYGAPAPTPFGESSRPDRSFVLRIQKKLGFHGGRFGYHWALNGRSYPRVPMFVVSRGDLVKVTIVNDSPSIHPMHLHGHHMLVLSRNGVANRGSPWWADTLQVDPGTRYEVAFRADNPGLWMDHCHNLAHATAGLSMHLMYAGVFTPYVIGGAAHNAPE
jgi:FtsP/CotA-like multicopper oxidase with cupredoxin domain